MDEDPRWSVDAEPYDGPVIQALVEAVQAEYVERYGSPDEAHVDPAHFLPPNGLLLVGRMDGEPVAMGGFRRLTADRAEIKRMYVPAEHRGKGLSRRLLAAIEQEAAVAGFVELWLNTGTMQPEAMSLYETSGYQSIPPFGHYADAPLARFYGKKI